jgi:ATP-binding protein involved in chromosome partitioning
LGEIPLLLDIRSAADAGTPIVASAPQSDAARAYRDVAVRLQAKLDGKLGQPGGPRIVIS